MLFNLTLPLHVNVTTRLQPLSARAQLDLAHEVPVFTPYERARIVQAYEDGRTPESIADQFHRPTFTISRTVRGASTHNEGTGLAWTGRPCTYTPRDQRLDKLAVERHPFWS